MIEIFKTNVQQAAESTKIIQRLLEHFPLGQITFDLEDCDKVLRVEHQLVCVDRIKKTLALLGYACEELE